MEWYFVLTIFIILLFLLSSNLYYSKIRLQKKYKDLENQFYSVKELSVQQQTELQYLHLKSSELQAIVSAKEEDLKQLYTKSTSLDVQYLNLENRYHELEQDFNQLQSNYSTLLDKNSEQTQLVHELELTLQNLEVAKKENHELIQSLNHRLEQNQKSLAEKSIHNHQLETQLRLLEQQLTQQKEEFEALHKNSLLQFERLANQIMEEKSQSFTALNKSNLESLLKPLKDDLHSFKSKVEETHTEDTKQRISLEERIKGLIEQTNKISAEANNLATALKGQSQKRGLWGEVILERILESSGLTKGREYFIQENFTTQDGQQQRFDVKIVLPDERAIIIDSKVSLIAYDQYFTSDDPVLQKRFLNEHIQSVKQHINQLSHKQYDDLDNSLDFTMMFVPIEPAYLLTVQHEPDIWNYAYEKRILLVSPTTLIACLKLFSDLWRREWQNKNAMAIVKKGEQLYDKVTYFCQSFIELGQKIQSTQKSYDQALNQLKDGKGNIITQAQQLKELGLKSSRKLPPSLLGSE